MQKVLITGASGLLGANLALDMSARWNVCAQYLQHPLASESMRCVQADLTDEKAASALFQKEQPDVVVHCAALTHVDTCEKQPELAYELNSAMAGIVARQAREAGAYLVHISTDAVFDGERGGYLENDEVNPPSVYARSKVKGEELVLEANPGAAVMRVNIFGWNAQPKFSLAEWFLDQLENGRRCKGFTDVFVTPTLVNDLVPLIETMAGKKTSGVVHAAGADCTCKYRFGVRIAETFGLDSSLIAPSTVEEVGLLAARGRRLCLKSERMQAELGIDPIDLKAGLGRMRSLRENGYTSTLKDLFKGGSHEGTENR